MQSKFPDETLDRLRRTGLVAVLVIQRLEHAVPVAKALLDGGIDAMELTLRTPSAVECLKAIRKKVPEMLPGAGTVLTEQQVDQVAEAGAAYAVAPGFNRRVVLRAQQQGLPFAPGVMTPSEIEAAVELGCRELKYFPAQLSGGFKMLTNLRAPYAHLGLQFFPLGGLNTDNVADYLKSPWVLAAGGSWLAPDNVIAAEGWQAITATARQARELVDAVRAGD